MELTVALKPVIAASAVESSTATETMWLAEGMHEAVSSYRHAAESAAASLTETAAAGASLPTESLKWERSTVVPVVTAFSPASSGLFAGTHVTITGVDFVLSRRVRDMGRV